MKFPAICACCRAPWGCLTQAVRVQIEADSIPVMPPSSVGIDYSACSSSDRSQPSAACRRGSVGIPLLRLFESEEASQPRHAAELRGDRLIRLFQTRRSQTSSPSCRRAPWGSPYQACSSSDGRDFIPVMPPSSVGIALFRLFEFREAIRHPRHAAELRGDRVIQAVRVQIEVNDIPVMPPSSVGIALLSLFQYR